MSILLVGCGSSDNTTQTSSDDPKPTATIRFNTSSQSPTPTLPPNTCGIWLVNPSPTYSSSGTITVYGKFSTNSNGNPVGIAGATATLSVQWGDLTTEPQTATTSSSGLATFSLKMASHYSAVNKLSLITAQFSYGNQNCSVDSSRPASFVLLQGTSTTKSTATVTTTSTSTSTGKNNGGGNTGGGGKKR